MRVLICGSRDFNQYVIFEENMKLFQQNYVRGAAIDEVVCRNTMGADAMGRLWALNKMILPRVFPVLWTLGKGAENIRDRQMIDYADSALVFWNGKDRGVLNMIRYIEKRQLPHMVVKY